MFSRKKTKDSKKKDSVENSAKVETVKSPETIKRLDSEAATRRRACQPRNRRLPTCDLSNPVNDALKNVVQAIDIVLESDQSAKESKSPSIGSPEISPVCAPVSENEDVTTETQTKNDIDIFEDYMYKDLPEPPVESDDETCQTAPGETNDFNIAENTVQNTITKLSSIRSDENIVKSYHQKPNKDKTKEVQNSDEKPSSSLPNEAEIKSSQSKDNTTKTSESKDAKKKSVSQGIPNKVKSNSKNELNYDSIDAEIEKSSNQADVASDPSRLINTDEAIAYAKHSGIVTKVRTSFESVDKSKETVSGKLPSGKDSNAKLNKSKESFTNTEKIDPTIQNADSDFEHEYQTDNTMISSCNSSNSIKNNKNVVNEENDSSCPHLEIVKDVKSSNQKESFYSCLSCKKKIFITSTACSNSSQPCITAEENRKRESSQTVPPEGFLKKTQPNILSQTQNKSSVDIGVTVPNIVCPAVPNAKQKSSNIICGSEDVSESDSYVLELENSPLLNLPDDDE